MSAKTVLIGTHVEPEFAKEVRELAAAGKPPLSVSAYVRWAVIQQIEADRGFQREDRP
jgi:hypothetical protein